MNTNQHATESLPQVTILGAGTMGSAVARRLLGCGFDVRASDQSGEALRALDTFGAETMSDPREAVRGAKVVLTWLPTADVAIEVMIGEGVLDAMDPGQVWAQMGTIGIEGTRQLAEAVSTRRPNVLFVDAPVSGSRLPAESGQLVILASGPVDAKSIVDPVFAAIGHRTLWLGDAGTGSRMKLVLNTWLAFEIEAAAEVMALAEHWKLEDEVLKSAVTGSPLVSAYAASKLEKMLSRDDTADFSLGLALKDLTLVEEAAGPHAPVAGTIAERWRGLIAQGAGGLDVSAARLGLA